MAKKNMTIEDLAASIDKRFDSVDKRFNSIDDRFDLVEKKIEDEIGNLAAMTKRQFDAQSEELKVIRQEQLVHDFKMTEMVHKADYFKLEERVNRLERKTGLRR